MKKTHLPPPAPTFGAFLERGIARPSGPYTFGIVFYRLAAFEHERGDNFYRSLFLVPGRDGVYTGDRITTLEGSRAGSWRDAVFLGHISDSALRTAPGHPLPVDGIMDLVAIIENLLRHLEEKSVREDGYTIIRRGTLQVLLAMLPPEAALTKRLKDALAGAQDEEVARG